MPRFALISPVLQAKGISVIHVRPDMKLQANEDLEKELIESVIGTKQMKISDEPVNSVDLMYENLNKKIAYKVKGYHIPADDAITDSVGARKTKRRGVNDHEGEGASLIMGTGKRM